MEIPLKLNGQRKRVKVVFAKLEDLKFVAQWETALGNDPNPYRVDTVDFARLAVKRYEASKSSGIYPLAPLNLYVIAKTWYAPEMPRPGCVWTHSLILGLKDMETIPSLEQLIKLFVRPKATKSDSKSPQMPEAYEHEIRFQPEGTLGYRLFTDESFSNQLLALVNSLYVKKHKNLLIAAPSSATFEPSIMRLWSQQWPALRSGFSFCSGALSSRGFAGKSFDVQCAPPQLIREITTSALAKQSQEMTILNPDEGAPDKNWLYSAISDAELPGGGQFRRLLWALADGGRLEDFEKFANVIVHFLSDESISLPQLITLVANHFPDKSSGAVLKRVLFCEKHDEILKVNFSELEILSELSVSEAHTAFVSETLNLRSRANQLCKVSHEDAELLISKIFRGPLNPLGEEVLAGLLEAINPQIARSITAHQPHFLPTLFRAKPELGTSAEFWRAAGDHVRELFESLASIDGLSEELITAISEAILSGGAESLAKRPWINGASLPYLAC
jgi:hypothetical protein